MTTSPRLGYTEWADGQDLPETTGNEIARWIEAFATRIIIKDRDLSTPAALTPSDGDAYLVKATGAGDWTGKSGKLALYINTAWVFITAKEGFRCYIEDEDTEIVYDGSSWVLAGAATATTVSTQSGTSYTAVLGDSNGYIRFTNGSSITFTIPPNASVAFPIGTVIEMEQAGAGALTVAPGSGVTINSRASDLTLAGQYSVAFVKKVATNTWTMNGDL